MVQEARVPPTAAAAIGMLALVWRAVTAPAPRLKMPLIPSMSISNADDGEDETQDAGDDGELAATEHAGRTLAEAEAAGW